MEKPSTPRINVKVKLDEGKVQLISRVLEDMNEELFLKWRGQANAAVTSEDKAQVVRFLSLEHPDRQDF